ncbi:hypothetical protein [Janthinobacterium sp.]|uniref:hypothetical protein n=1 Tax=Janthinobacterium sp. TaxID=1871054 RepID=UPI002589ACF4|nr:hypothetical protein [Janthinobacterium sp.]MCX7289568.1 hypothetical protein [Janthinobacterium sp.]
MMDSIWPTLVSECLEEIEAVSGPRAIAGAPFSQMLKKKATAKDLQFPPPPYKTFRPFIDSDVFKSIVIVHTRPGRDILIVPADRADLLSSDQLDSTANRVREDLFTALTRIPKNSNVNPFYLPATDEVVWFKADTAKPAEAVDFPRATFDQEISDRKSFIESADVNLIHTSKSALSLALESGSPLGAFSNAIRSLELSVQWHRFRMSAVITRLQRWSSEKGIPWKSAWISESTPKPSELPAAEQVATPAVEVLGSSFGRNFLAALADVVTDEDLSRITVPLDLVAKAWNATRH